MELATPLKIIENNDREKMPGLVLVDARGIPVLHDELVEPEVLEEIVAAVNAHDGLVAALEKFDKTWIEHDSEDLRRRERWLYRAYKPVADCLAAAKGEA